YACCGGIHSTLDTVREVSRQRGVGPHDVRRVTVRSIEALATWFHGRRPPTMVDAQFSVPHAVTMAMLDRPRPEWWQATNRDDPVVRALMDRVALEADPAAQEVWTTVRHSARVPVTVIVETAGRRFAGTRG